MKRHVKNEIVFLLAFWAIGMTYATLIWMQHDKVQVAKIEELQAIVEVLRGE